jgi:Xaa-Pro aminopeptidase
MEENGASLFMVVCPVAGGFRNWLTGTDGPGRPSEGAILVGKTGNVITVNGGSLVPRGKQGERNYAMAPGMDGDIFQGYSSCEGFSADLIEEMMGAGEKKIAVANFALLRADLYEYLQENLPETELIDVSGQVAALRAVKSEVEQEILKQNVRMMEKIFAGAGIYINPQKYEREIVTDLRYAAYRLGCGGVDHLLTAPVELVSGKDGAAKDQLEVLFPGRKVEFGDRVNVKMMALGNDGYFAGLARSFVLGEPCETTKGLWQTAVEIQNLAASLLVPGAYVGAVADRVNEALQQKGCLEDKHTMIHGIGSCIVEEPHTFDGQKLPLQENMVVYVGPTVDNGIDEPLSCGDLYIVKENGCKRLGTFPRELIRLY